MQNTFGLEIYAANRQFFVGRACSLIIPAEDGQKEFLAHHANMICAIVPGVKRSRKAEMVTDADIIFWAPVRLRRHLVSKHIWKKMRWKEP